MKRFIPTSSDQDLLYQISAFSHSLHPSMTFALLHPLSASEQASGPAKRLSWSRSGRPELAVSGLSASEKVGRKSGQARTDPITPKKLADGKPAGGYSTGGWRRPGAWLAEPST
ncbi:hypothetical protein MKK65_06870 [Methylobacterium sp. J-001]|uniref:hypothetical protein n=1 Tax=Methylobacterium sp. J-001 TaxID=2836609 RepID=UPI001FBA2335|nr:hypothetical protein [Methylobacterium sp. J-001]MCJ2116304.1 hypothetical protein [Methylobacterium sp. J-001]